MSTFAKVIRPLDRDEQSMHLTHEEMNGNSTMAWTAVLEGPLDPQRLERIGNQLIEHIQPLRVTVSGNQAPVFIESNTPPACLIRTYPRQNSDSWRTVAEQEINEKFDCENGPLWRLVIVAESAAADSRWELILVCQHNICDGFSATRFFDQLLMSYAHDRVDPEQLSLSSDYPLPIDELLPSQQQGWRGALKIVEYLGNAIAKSVRLPPVGRPLKGNIHSNQTGIVHGSLAPEYFQKLKSRAKQHGASLHGAMLAAQMLAVKDFFPDQEAAIGIVTTVNLRPRLPKVAEENMCVRLGCLYHAEKISAQTQFWQLAQTMADDVKYQLGQGFDQVSGKIGLMQLKRMVKKPQPSINNLQFANIGPSLVASQHANLRIHAMHGAQNFNGMETVLCAIVTNHDDRLLWNVNFVEQQYQRSDVEAYLQRTLALLMQAVN